MIYLDYAATAPVPRAVADAMYEVLAGRDYLCCMYGGEIIEQKNISVCITS